MMKSPILSSAIALLAVAATAIAQKEDSTFRESLTVDPTAMERSGPMLKSYADVIEKMEPSLVKISTSREVLLRRRTHPLMDDPYFRELFGIQDLRQPQGPADMKTRQPLALGSGVIVTKSGYILTNNHVIEGADEILVYVAGREEPLKASLIQREANSDVAVIKVEAENLKPAVLADSDKSRVGDIVFACGAPFGFEKTVNMGIVSAIRHGDTKIIGQRHLIQTDASINQGNSGGPLIDADGRVIGINTAIYTENRGNVGIGFAIPINRAVQIASMLVDPENAGGLLGVDLQPVTERIAQYFGMKEARGAIIAGVEAGSPAAKAGLRMYDVVLEFQGKEVEDHIGLLGHLTKLPAGTEVTLKVLREKEGNGRRVAAETVELKATLADRKKFLDEKETAAEAEATAKGENVAGMQLQELTPEVRKALGLRPSATGLVVVAVEPNSTAANSGIQAGEIITQINRQAVNTLDEARAALADAKDGAFLLHIRQGSATRIVPLGVNK